MAKKFIKLGTNGYETSIENEDVLARLISDQGWTAGLQTTSIQFIPDELCVVKINGIQSTVTAGEKLTVVVEDINGGYVESFVTVTSDVSFVFNATF